MDCAQGEKCPLSDIARMVRVPSCREKAYSDIALVVRYFRSKVALGMYLLLWFECPCFRNALVMKVPFLQKWHRIHLQEIGTDEVALLVILLWW